MVIALDLALVLLGLAALAVMTFSQRLQLAAPPPPATEILPPVTILKPMRGVDAGLEGNLSSFFRLDYPSYEILLGVDDPADSALAIARQVAAKFPQVASRIVVDGRRIGSNPKVNNLANLWRHGRHDVLLISDSNVRVQPGYLRDMVAHLGQPNVGLVSSPIRGTAGLGLGAALEALQLNTFVMGGVSAMHRLLGGVCVVGKSMLMRRSTLAAIGGFERLARFLAEDQVSGQEVARLGRRVALSSLPVDNVLGPLGAGAFVARHLRWAGIRRRIAPAGYLGELLLNPVAVATAGVLLAPGTGSVAVLAGVLVAKSALDCVAERSTGIRRAIYAYPALVLVKDLLIGAVWAVPFFSRTVAWRGRRYRIGRRTELVALAGSRPKPLGSAGGSVAGWSGAAPAAVGSVR